MVDFEREQFWKLLQLASPALPVGAYSYSEGLETLREQEQLNTAQDLQNWLEQELRYGSIATEGAVLVQAFQAVQQDDGQKLCYWNQWWSAWRETEELRNQSWQMGRSLSRLGMALEPGLVSYFQVCGDPCNFVIAFATIAAVWQLSLPAVVAAYLYSWLSNQVNAGIRLIPLGQTAGQQVLLNLHPSLEYASHQALTQPESEWAGWSHGLGMVSSQHEHLYTRLFQS
ncbi:MAG: urease accessory protein UreF [Prochlorotrichaceae cyanobacterium]